MPRFQEIIYLGSSEVVRDAFGNEDEVFDWRKVYANRWRDGERGKTATTGLVTEDAGVYEKREIRRYEVRTADYNGEWSGKVFDDGKVWEITSSWRGERTLLEFKRDVV